MQGRRGVGGFWHIQKNKCQTSSLSFLSLCRAVRGAGGFWKTEAQNLSQAQFSLL